MSTGDDFIHSSELIWSLRHPECQNLSIISDSIDRVNSATIAEEQRKVGFKDVKV